MSDIERSLLDICIEEAQRVPESPGVSLHVNVTILLSDRLGGDYERAWRIVSLWEAAQREDAPAKAIILDMLRYWELPEFADCRDWPDLVHRRRALVN